MPKMAQNHHCPTPLWTLVILVSQVSAEIAIMHYGHFGGLSITCNRDQLILMESELLGYSTNSDCNPQPLCSVPYTLAKWYCRGKSTCAGMQVERRPLHKRTCGNDFTNCLRVEYKCISMRKLTDVCSDTIYEASSGYISSPNFPEMYPPDRNCTCSLTAAPEEHVRVYSAFFLLKSNTPCNDWVRLTVDSEVSTKCGYIPEQKVHVGRKVNLNFRSDQKSSEMGFWFKFSGIQGSPVTVRCGRYAFMDSKVSPKRLTEKPTTIRTTIPPTTTTTTTQAPTTKLLTTTTTQVPLLQEESKFITSYRDTQQDEIEVNKKITGEDDPQDETGFNYDEEEFKRQWQGTTPSLSRPTELSEPDSNSKLQVLQHDTKKGVQPHRLDKPRNGKPKISEVDKASLVDPEVFQKTQFEKGNQNILYAEPTPHPHHSRQPRSTIEPDQTYGSIHEDGFNVPHRDKFNTLKIETADQELKFEVLPTRASDNNNILDNTVHHVHTMRTNEVDQSNVAPTPSTDLDFRQAPLPKETNVDDNRPHFRQAPLPERLNSDNSNDFRQAPLPDKDSSHRTSDSYPLDEGHDQGNIHSFIKETPTVHLIDETKDYNDYDSYNYEDSKNKHVIGDYQNYQFQRNTIENPLDPVTASPVRNPQKRFEDVVSKVNEIKETLEQIQKDDDDPVAHNDNIFRERPPEMPREDLFISEAISKEFDEREKHIPHENDQTRPSLGIQQPNVAMNHLEDADSKQGDHNSNLIQTYTESIQHNTIHQLPKQEPLTAKKPADMSIVQQYETLPRDNRPVDIDYEKDFDSDPEDSLYALESAGVTEKLVSAENGYYKQITAPPRTPVTPDYDMRHHVHSVAPWNSNSLATGEFKPAVNHIALVDETTKPTTPVTTTNRPFRTAEVITLKGSLDENGVLLGSDNSLKNPPLKNSSKILKKGIEFSDSELYGVIQTKILKPKKQDPMIPTTPINPRTGKDKYTEPTDTRSSGNMIYNGADDSTMVTSNTVAATDSETGSEGSQGLLTSTTDTELASESTQKKSGTVWILLVIAIIGWIIFMAFLGLVIYYRRDRLPCRRSFTRMQNSPQTQKSTMPKQLALPSLAGPMPFGLKVAPLTNASTQTRRKQAMPLFSSDGESSRSSTSLGSHLLSPSITSTPTPPDSNSPIQNRPLPPLPRHNRPPPPPPPSTPGGRSMGIQTIANSNICTQTEQSNCSQTDLTLMFNPFESISKAINRRSSYRDLESISKALGRKASFAEIRSQPPTPIRERYPPGQYAELPKKKPFATINAGGLSALNNLNNSNISSWALHRIASFNKEKRPRMLLRRNSSKQSKISNRSISPQVSFSIPSDVGQEGEIIDLSTPAFKRARCSSRALSRNSSTCSAINPYSTTSHIIHGNKTPHPHIPPSNKHPPRSTPAHTPYPAKYRDSSPMSPMGSEPHLIMNSRSSHHTPQPVQKHGQASPLHHGMIHRLASPPIKPGPFRPPPPNPPQPQSPAGCSSVRSNDFPPPPPEIMLTDPPSNQSPPKKRLPIPYQQISTDFTLQKTSTPPTPKSSFPVNKSHPPLPQTPKSTSSASRSTYALPMKSVFGKAQEKAGSSYADGKQNNNNLNGEAPKHPPGYTDFYFSGDGSAPLVFNNDGRSSTSSRSSTAPELPPKHFTPMSSMRRAPPTPPPPPEVGTLTRQHSNRNSKSDLDSKNNPETKDTNMDLQRIGPNKNGVETSQPNPVTNTNERRTRDTSTERMRRIVPQQANMFHDMVQPELQAILDKRRTKSEPVEV